MYIYVCMYLSQAVSLPPQLGTESDFFQHDSLPQEVQLEPALVACSVAVPNVPAVAVQFGQLGEGKTGPFLPRIARVRLNLRPELGPESRNSAHQTVRPSDNYSPSYSLFIVCVEIMYICVYVPVAGRIAPATARNRVGLLPTRFPTAGGPVRARAGRLQRRGA